MRAPDYFERMGVRDEMDEAMAEMPVEIVTIAGVARQVPRRVIHVTTPGGGNSTHLRFVKEATFGVEPPFDLRPNNDG